MDSCSSSRYRTNFLFIPICFMACLFTLKLKVLLVMMDIFFLSTFFALYGLDCLHLSFHCRISTMLFLASFIQEIVVELCASCYVLPLSQKTKSCQAVTNRCCVWRGLKYILLRQELGILVYFTVITENKV